MRFGGAARAGLKVGHAAAWSLLAIVRDCIGRAELSVGLRYPKHPGVHAGKGVWVRTMSGRDLTRSAFHVNEYRVQRPDLGRPRAAALSSRTHGQT